MDKIIINKEYFDNVATAINSINDFISSNFTNKNFPTVEDDVQLDGTLLGILSWLNNVDPELVQDPDNLNQLLEEISEHEGEYNGPDVLSQLPEELADKVYAVIGCKALEFISNNFEDFSKLVNGIYTFELFTNPSKYADVIETFSQPLELYELRTALNDDIDITLFDPEKYVSGIFNNDQIQLPNNMDQVVESERIKKHEDLKDVEIMVDETKMEAAEIDFFEKDRPKHLKFSNGKWMVSQQFQKLTNDIVKALRDCNSTADLMMLFSKPNKGMTDFIGQTVAPFILVKTLTNPKKSSSEIDEDTMKKYTDSCESIIKQNKGAGRFKNYDLFSCFKTDKDATIKFIEDFMNLNLLNDENCGIDNNTLLTLFNIFDSHIYLTLMYNLMPTKNGSVDEFIKTTRARINKNSREAMKYKEQDEMKKDNELNDSKTVKEYTSIMEKEFGDMSTLDIQYCEGFQSLLYDEISTMNDALYNEGFSQIGIHNWIGESYNFYAEQENGEIPDYIKRRMNMSDDLGTTKTPTTTDVNVPPETPRNSYDDLTNSIDERMDTETDKGLEGMLGKGYDGPIEKDGSKPGRHVVYNITYNNSFNKDSNNTRTDTHTNTNTTTNNDNSQNKHEEIDNTQNMHNSNNMTNSQNDSSHNKDESRDKRIEKRNDSHNTSTTTNTHSSDSHNTSNVNKTTTTNSHNSDSRGTNNYNNSNTSSDTVASKDDNKLSNGLTVNEMFTILESIEPLSEAAGAKPPKEDSLTKAMDKDRRLLSTQQEAKRKVQKGINTTRAALKPVSRAKQWMTNIVDSLIKRDEDEVKAQIVESPSYRTALYKASRLALKLGLVGVAWTVSGYLAAAVAGIEVLKAIDKDRLKKEVQGEMITEIKILDDKIDRLEEVGTPEALKKKYEYMRMRNKMVNMAATARRTRITNPNSIA
jgi:hypothetical protein